jgi:HEPN domain-containing protein
MSLEKNRQEAERWLITAEGDLETAIILLENNKFAHFGRRRTSMH